MSSRRIFTGQVSSDGKRVVLDAPIFYLNALSKMKGKRVSVVLEYEGERRSGGQNRRFFHVVIPVCVEILNQKLREQGSIFRFDKDSAHDFLDAQFLGHDTTPLGQVRKRCSTLDVGEFSRHMEEIEGFFIREYGAEFPTEQEVKEAGL